MSSIIRSAIVSAVALGALGALFACSGAPTTEREGSSESAATACAATDFEITLGEGDFADLEGTGSESTGSEGDDAEPDGIPGDDGAGGEGGDDGLAVADAPTSGSGAYALMPRAVDAGTKAGAGTKADAGAVCKPAWCSDPAKALTPACQAGAGDKWGGNKKDQYYRLQKYWCYGKKPDGTSAITGTGWIKPKPGDTCTELKDRANRARNCIRARKRVRECYVPACQDANHVQSIDEATRALDNVLDAGGKQRPPCTNL